MPAYQVNLSNSPANKPFANDQVSRGILDCTDRSLHQFFDDGENDRQKQECWSENQNHADRFQVESVSTV